MLARVHSCAKISLEGNIIEVEVDTGQGLTGMTVFSPKDRIVSCDLGKVHSLWY